MCTSIYIAHISSHYFLIAGLTLFCWMKSKIRELLASFTSWSLLSVTTENFLWYVPGFFEPPIDDHYMALVYRDKPENSKLAKFEIGKLRALKSLGIEKPGQMHGTWTPANEIKRHFANSVVPIRPTTKKSWHKLCKSHQFAFMIGQRRKYSIFLIGEYLLLTESRKYQLPGLLPVFRGLTYLSSRVLHRKIRVYGLWRLIIYSYN